MKLRIQNQIILYFVVILVAISGFFLTVMLPRPEGFYAFLTITGLGGLAIAANIFYTKSRHISLVCPTGSDCNAVVKSRFSKFIGIPLEILGMGYFLVIIASYIILLIMPQLLDTVLVTGIALLTIGAALFSCYLLSVQAFLLRKWCIWCILASILSLTIFFISLISLAEWTTWLGQLRGLLEFLQFLGYALGLGGVTAGVFLFGQKFLRDRDITNEEFDTLKHFSELIWLGFGLVLMMQLAFFVLDDQLINSGPFLAGLIALMISAVAGALIMVVLSPYIVFLPFTKPQDTQSWLAGLQKPIFGIGAVGISAWYFSFTTHFLPADLSLAVLIISLLAVLAIAITLALWWEWQVTHSRPIADQTTDGIAEIQTPADH